MTEERIKELAGKVWAEYFEPYAGLLMSKYELTQFICTVAAEARKEGIEALRDEILNNLTGYYFTDILMTKEKSNKLLTI